MSRYKLASQCTPSRGEIAPRWSVDPDIKPNLVNEGEFLAGVQVVDLGTAVSAFAQVLARDKFGEHA